MRNCFDRLLKLTHFKAVMIVLHVKFDHPSFFGYHYEETKVQWIIL